MVNLLLINLAYLGCIIDTSKISYAVAIKKLVKAHHRRGCDYRRTHIAICVHFLIEREHCGTVWFIKKGQLMLQLVRQPLVVAVQKRYKPAYSSFYPDIPGSSRLASGSSCMEQLYPAVPGTVLFCYSCASVGGSIIYYK